MTKRQNPANLDANKNSSINDPKFDKDDTVQKKETSVSGEETKSPGPGSLTTRPDIDLNLEKILGSSDPSTIIKKQATIEVTKGEITKIIKKIQKTKEIGFKAAANAVAALFRKGAANAGAADSMQVELLCPETTITTEISRYDIIMALYSVTNHKNIRKLAEAMSPEMLSANLKLVKVNPLLDLKGDLSNRINRRLALRKEPALSREEEICCSTYAQWMPNLNELANSTRLVNLLTEDLNARRQRNAKTNFSNKAKANQATDKRSQAKAFEQKKKK